MTQQQHPITPPPELVQQWVECWKVGKYAEAMESDFFVAARAAQWGADQELEACCEWIDADSVMAAELRATRRPKPPSLKEQALEALAHILNNSSTQLGADTIRRALEQLPDHE